MKAVPCGIITRPKIIYHINEGRCVTCMFITEISPKQELQLDKGNNITVKLGKSELNIHPSDVAFYGEMDLNTSSEDYNTIANSNLLSNLSFSGIKIPLHYDYENHMVYTDGKVIKNIETFRPEKVIQYFHGLINKPKLCAIITKKIWRYGTKS